MRVIRKILGVIFTLIAVPLLILAACNAAVDSTLRAPETYANTLENDAIFEDLASVALPAIIQANNSQNQNLSDNNLADESPVKLNEVISALDTDVWREVTNLLVSSDWLQERTDQLVTSMLEVVNGNPDVIDEPFDLTDLRQRLVGEEAQAAATLIIENSPECTQTQTDQIRTLIATQEGHLPICNPSNASQRENSITILTFWFAELADALESDIPTVSKFLEINRDNAQVISLIFDIDRQGMLLLFLCPLALLALTITLAIRSFIGFGRWVGVAFITAGVGVLLMLAIVQIMAFNIVSEVLNAQTDLEIFLGRIISEIARSAFSKASGTMFVFMGLYIAIGFILLGLSWIITRDDDHNDGEMVLISEDGEIISTASQKRIGT
ncbi:MAG: hypothetical protein Q9P44_08910, partial [Anaerolineae bacterium]|nr:hypothetical protein [Anaerolineae bacterium]